MVNGKKYREWVIDNYNEIVKDFCNENAEDFEIYCLQEFHIMEEFAEGNSDFEQYCRDRYEG